MSRPDQCCGSAGVYNVVENDLSMEILKLKMDDVAATEAEVLVTANVGCMLQLRAGIQQRKLGMDVLHVVELLDRLYEPPLAKRRSRKRSQAQA